MRFSGLLIGGMLFFFSLISGQSRAGSGSEQDVLTRLMDQEQSNQIRLSADSLLIVNYYKLITQNKKKAGIPGYRILIYSDSGIGAKEEQQRVRARFLSLFPELDAYYHYDEPFFKVYVGDFRTESEAWKLFDQIKKNFPNSILREDQIKIKSLE